MAVALLAMPIEKEADVAAVRRRAREVAQRVGFDAQAQTRLAAAVSEIARNALQYAGRGQVQFCLENSGQPRLEAEISDRGPGLPADYHLSPGMGIASARRLVDALDIEPRPGGGAAVRLRMNLPPATRLPGERAVAGLQGELAGSPPAPVMWPEFQQLNQELMRALAEAEQLRREVAALNAELENTNRGVVALYAELDEKAEQLKRADELKTRFFSNMSHEFRTPVNSVLALSRLLLDRVDGELSEEQEKQVTFIRQAAQELGELVNDLLDLVKVDAGRVVVRPTRFEATTLLATLRAMFRPLATNPAVAFVVEEPAGLPPLYTDESKLSQIVRNFISNALKFTERGEVRVTVEVAPGGHAALFVVRDTGIGIAPDDQARIFQEFGQLDNPIQKRVRGTGLGLALSKRLAELLGGRIGLHSEPGRGSMFFVAIPLVYGSSRLPPEAAYAPGAGGRPGGLAPAEERLDKVLIVDDDPIARYLVKGLLAGRMCLILEASDGVAGLQLARQEHPDVILLDLMMPGLTGAEVLERLKADPATRGIPVIVITSHVLEPDERHKLGSQAVAILNKEILGGEDVAAARETVAAVLDAAVPAGTAAGDTGADSGGHGHG